MIRNPGLPLNGQHEWELELERDATVALFESKENEGRCVSVCKNLKT